MGKLHDTIGKIPFGVTKYIMNDVTAFDTTNHMLEQVRVDGFWRTFSCVVDLG